jgi:hypothetical protein
VSDGALSWEQVLKVASEAAEAAQEGERRVLLVLADRAFHVREVLAPRPAAPSSEGMLGFVVYQDDPELAQRTDDTSLLFVRPEQVLRLQVLGYDPQADGRRLGFPSS